MDTISFVREQVRQAREFLDGTMADVSEEQAHAAPDGVLNPIAATYAHLVCGEDWFVSGYLRRQSPLMASS